MRLLVAAATLFAVSLMFGARALAQKSPSGSGSSGDAWRTLSGRELQDLLVRHKLGGLNRFGKPYLIAYHQDGAVAAKAHPDSGGGDPKIILSDTGRWRIEGDALCVQMVHWLAGNKACWHLATNGSAYRWVEASPYFQPEVFLDAVPWSGGVWAW